jgi:hypothetical protein
VTTGIEVMTTNVGEIQKIDTFGHYPFDNNMTVYDIKTV